MKLKRNKIATLPFGETIQVTDPGYDSDVWCRGGGCGDGVYKVYVLRNEDGKAVAIDLWFM